MNFFKDVGLFRKRRILSSKLPLSSADFETIAGVLGKLPLVAKKIGFVAARRVDTATTIETIVAGRETVNTAQAGDWIVTNMLPSGQPFLDKRGRRNVYVIRAADFDRLYARTDRDSDDGPLFFAKGSVLALELPGGFDIQTPWQYRQTGNKGFLVRNDNDVYCIEKTVFHRTYDLLGPGALKLRREGKKRMLSLDGGGARGMLTLAILERLEDVLRKQHGNPTLVLADYFDMIGGTSVGAIIATLLALGEDVATIKALFKEWGPGIFRRPPVWRRVALVTPRFHARHLEKKLAARLGDMRLGSPELKTGLCIITKRVDTGSPWVLTNNPRSIYWAGRTGTVVANKDYRLADVVRASAAAPYYFRSHKIRVALDETPGRFVDGGVSPFNNPALQMLMLCGIKGYGLNWPLGEDNLLLVSVGTGTYRLRTNGGGLAVRQALDALQGVIGDNETLSLTLLQWLSASANPWRINGEIGDLSDDFIGQDVGLTKRLLRFQRYDAPLETEWLQKRLQKDVSGWRLEQLRDFTNAGAENLAMLEDIGIAAAERQVQESQFPVAFKVAADA